MHMKFKLTTVTLRKRSRLLLSVVFAITLAGAHSLGAEDRPADTLAKERSSSARWAKPAVEEVLPGVWRVRFGTPERFTPNAVREAGPRVAGFKSLPTPTPLPFKPGQIRCRISASRTTVYVPCDEPGEQIYGFGLDPGAYQQKGLCKTLTVCAGVVGQTGASHGPVPFYLSTKGYGVYVDTARVPVVEVARLPPINPPRRRKTAPPAAQDFRSGIVCRPGGPRARRR